jgi:hypothetical protein
VHIAGRFVACEMTIRGERNAPEPGVAGRWEMRLATDEMQEVTNEE